MVNCYKCGKFSIFESDYNGMCQTCYNKELEMEKYRKELDLKIKKQTEIDREERLKKYEEQRKQREEKIRKTLEEEREKKKRRKIKEQNNKRQERKI